MKQNEVYGIGTAGIKTTLNEVYGFMTNKTTPNVVYGTSAMSSLYLFLLSIANHRAADIYTCALSHT